MHIIAYPANKSNTRKISVRCHPDQSDITLHDALISKVFCYTVFYDCVDVFLVRSAEFITYRDEYPWHCHLCGYIVDYYGIKRYGCHLLNVINTIVN